MTVVSIVGDRAKFVAYVRLIHMPPSSVSCLEKPNPPSTRYSFGATSAIITNLALITGLDTAVHAKVSIISSLLIIALADNISDSLGIHIHQESELCRKRDVWFSTCTNFFTRLGISTGFMLLVIFLPLSYAVPCAITYGFFVLTYVSAVIAREKQVRVAFLIAEHISIATAVVAASHYIGRWIVRLM